MELNMYFLVAIVIVVLIVIGLANTGISAYNRLVMLKNNVAKSFGNIDIILKQRADEIPDLIKVVKESMHFEESMLTKLTELRTQFLKSNSPEEKVALSNDLQNQIKSIFAVAENYPDLKSNQSLQLLQSRVSQIEDAIADRREFYNESVNMYNIGIAEFPDLIVAKVINYQAKSLLQVSTEEKNYNGIVF
ncbi:LemA family protein [Frigoriflavimonas asaccharolytica]|uniref:LemA protein n=1 Tax=Frigoriflavimonas asaccharolytica TaxID=2735899 RepID=A0A8J8G8H0_9FLAO|nr:LemA family protein [Frigoriflavimonas asaccharolytica]NRS93266.1 LemA protein [Frigoriflavimonas asaccharolytica]